MRHFFSPILNNYVTLKMKLSVHIWVKIPIFLSIVLSVDPSVDPFVDPFIESSVNLSVDPSVDRSTHLYVKHLPIGLSTSLFFCSSCGFAHLSVDCNLLFNLSFDRS